MADKNNKGVTGKIMGAEDGYLYVLSLEQRSLNEYLAIYQAKINGYRVDQKDYGTRVTMRIDFPPETSKGNANLWAFFIASAAHKLGKKPYIEVRGTDYATIAYVSFTIWDKPKYLESKQGPDIAF